MGALEVKFTLPTWVDGFTRGYRGGLATTRERMRFVIELARQNVIHCTGGPFAAAVFDAEGALVAPGVNIVVPAGCSLLHAEMTALALAQKRTGTHDLSAAAGAPFELVSSAEPCAMCLGAIPWSGVGHLVCGARDEDVRRIGFDEGAKVDDWARALEKRGITVTPDVVRDEAAAVFDLYVQSGGLIYNAGRTLAAPKKERR
ncbi:MAG: nucleoside deaminase [Planctomycetota bacterium]